MSLMSESVSDDVSSTEASVAVSAACCMVMPRCRFEGDESPVSSMDGLRVFREDVAVNDAGGGTARCCGWVVWSEVVDPSGRDRELGDSATPLPIPPEGPEWSVARHLVHRQ